MRIFLDANILFSAAKSAGAIRWLLDRLWASGHECTADAYVTGEARRNLEHKFPTATPDLERILENITTVISPPLIDTFHLEKLLPEQDRLVLASAIHNHCQVLLTGDKLHFGSLYGKTIEEVMIHSPQSLVKRMQAHLLE